MFRTVDILVDFSTKGESYLISAELTSRNHRTFADSSGAKITKVSFESCALVRSSQRDHSAQRCGEDILIYLLSAPSKEATDRRFMKFQGASTNFEYVFGRCSRHQHNRQQVATSWNAPCILAAVVPKIPQRRELRSHGRTAVLNELIMTFW